MSVFRNSVVGDFTRGGQTTIHFMRMIWQVTKKFFRICLVSYLLAVTGFIYYFTTANERYYAYKYIEARIYGEVFKSRAAITNIQYVNGTETKISYGSILNSRAIIKYVDNLLFKIYLALGLSIAVSIVIGLIVLRFIYITGRSQASDDFVRGTEIVGISHLRKLIRKFDKKYNAGRGSGLTIANVELPYRFDKSHVLLIGSTGTGKSVNLREALESIRKNGRRAIVYDVAGNFIKHFYRKDKDIILNPMDIRSHSWDLFSDCKVEADFISFAESMIPDSYRRDFFDVAAKVVFSSIAYQLSLEQNPSIKKLMDLLLKVDFETIVNFVKNTDAASIINEEAGRMAASVRGVISANTRSLKFLKEGTNKFSIANWVQNDKTDSWVFISCNDKQIDMLRPVITAWFNIFTSNVLSLSEDENRRIYMVVDELPSLNKIPSLKNYLAQGRKYGGSGLIGIQNYSQLVSIYGKHDADAICDLCSTWLVLRCNSKEGAKWASDNIGNREIVETNEGLSFGINDIRDGVSVNKHRADRLVVSPTEIMHLPDLTGYIKLGRGFPVAKFISKYKKYPQISEHFIEDTSFSNLDIIHKLKLADIMAPNPITDGIDIKGNKELRQDKKLTTEYLIDDMEI